jgi:hypothetical protein
MFESFFDGIDSSFIGKIPEDISLLTELYWITIKHTGVSGGIPDDVCNLEILLLFGLEE